MKRLILVSLCASLLCGQTIIRRRQMPVTGALAAPTFDNGTNTYSNDVSVTITPPSGATGCYTTSGADPAATAPGTCSTGTTYSTPVAITATATVLKALATQGGQANSSITSATYTLQGATPTASPAAGTVSAGSTVTWSSTTTGTVTFHYRTDGVDPTCSTGTTGSSVTVSSSTTYKVVACKASYLDSAVASFAYTTITGITIVSKTSFQDDTGGTTSTTPAMNCVGANLIVAIYDGSNDAISFADNVNGGTYTMGTSITPEGGFIRMAYLQNASVSSSLQITATSTGSPQWRRVAAWCLAGASTTAALDGSLISATGTSASGNATTAAITPSASTGIILAMVSNNDGTTCVFTANNGFTLSFGPLGGTATFDTAAIEKLGASGAQTPSIGMTATGGSWRMVAGAFKQ